MHGLSIAASPDQLDFGPLDTEEAFFVINPGDEELSFSLTGGKGIAVVPQEGTIQPGGKEMLRVTRTSNEAGGSIITVSPVGEGVIPGITIPVSLSRSKPVEDKVGVKKIIDAKVSAAQVFGRLDSGKKGLLIIMAEVTLGLLCWKYLRNRRSLTC